MSFVSFTTGDILYLTGRATNLFGQDAQKLMPRQNVLTTLFVTGYVLVQDALPVRQRPGSEIEGSMYSPPIRLLAGEKGSFQPLEGGENFATLSRIDILSQDLATFTFALSSPVHIEPGHAAILDFSDLFGKQEYAHMAPGKEASINDDRIRTWTVSSAHTHGSEGTRSFEITVREKPGGLVTGALFSMARKIADRMPDALGDARPLGLRVRLVGIAGEFTLPSDMATGRKMLWVAGGIGLTPFLSMLAALTASTADEAYDIFLAISTREPELLLRLVHKALSATEGHSPAARVNLQIHVFSSLPGPVSLPNFLGNVSVRVHEGRFSFGAISAEPHMDVTSRTVYICGPPAFEESVLESLARYGVEKKDVIRENFAY